MIIDNASSALLISPTRAEQTICQQTCIILVVSYTLRDISEITHLLTISSSVNVGTTFTFSLPFDKTQFNTISLLLSTLSRSLAEIVFRAEIKMPFD